MPPLNSSQLAHSELYNSDFFIAIGLVYFVRGSIFFELSVLRYDKCNHYIYFWQSDSETSAGKDEKCAVLNEKSPAINDLQDLNLGPTD